jgi:hypothetical protein
VTSLSVGIKSIAGLDKLQAKQLESYEGINSVMTQARKRYEGLLPDLRSSEPEARENALAELDAVTDWLVVTCSE